MMEIEFRGKCKNDDNNDDGKWAYGFYAKSYGSISGVKSVILSHDNGKSYLCRVVIDRKTAGQYTGLKDKNGVKIFEGDILQDEDKTLGTVEFNKGRFVGSFYGRTYYSELYFDAEKSEVIGNIHDNPELKEA